MDFLQKTESTPSLALPARGRVNPVGLVGSSDARLGAIQ